MRLVSDRIQSTNYDSVEFLGDLITFVDDIKCVNGMEKNRVEVFEALIRRAIKQIKCMLPCNSQAHLYKMKEFLGDAITTNGSNSNNKFCKAVFAPGSDTNHTGDVRQKLVVGITDLFQKAIDCTTCAANAENETCSFSDHGTTADTAAERVSTMFRSLYEHGSRHGCELSTQFKKRKSVEMSRAQREQSAASSQNHKNQHLKDSQASKIAPLAAAQLSAQLPEADISDLLQTTEKADFFSNVDRSSQTVKKKQKPNYVEMPMLDWLKVDITRTNAFPPPCAALASLPNASSQISLNTNGCDAVGGTSSNSIAIDGYVGTVPSIFIGVYPMIRERSGSEMPSVLEPSAGDEVIYSANMNFQGRFVDLGIFHSEEAAARAHDRALIRAIGPSNCRSCDLNYPINLYSSEPLSRFTDFDELLKAQLTVTSWNGLKPCDFGFLLARSKGKGNGHGAVLKTPQKMAPFSAGPSMSAAAPSPRDTRKNKSRSTSESYVQTSHLLKDVAMTSSASSIAVEMSSSSSSSLLSLSSQGASSTSSSLKSRIVRDGEIERIMVPPPPIGSVVSVANAPFNAAISNV